MTTGALVAPPIEDVVDEPAGIVGRVAVVPDVATVVDEDGLTYLGPPDEDVIILFVTPVPSLYLAFS